MLSSLATLGIVVINVLIKRCGGNVLNENENGQSEHQKGKEGNDSIDQGEIKGKRTSSGFM